MKRTLALISAALLGAALVPATASAQNEAPYHSCANVARSSWYGTVEAVHPGFITLRTNSGEGWVHVNTQDARINYNGQALRPGVWAGVFGCDIESSNDHLVAENMTLSSSPSTYPSYARYDRSTITGRVTAIRAGRFRVATNDGHGNTWVLGNANGLRIGEWVAVTGRFESNDRAFVASSVRVR